MNASRTARERARAELSREIRDEARRQLAVTGADGLSLRAVARELGMVSSALYRYYPSRDDLLTALIIDAYDALGAAAESAAAAVDSADFRGRWRAITTAVREWARAHRYEYALIYGSPVPGYRAPEDTVAPASRVALALVAVLRDAWQAGAVRPAPPERPLSEPLSAQVQTLAAAIAPELPGPVLARALIAWTQLFGMVSFELFGQLVGDVDPSDEFFAHAVDHMADFVGLPAET
ncbi:TetR/AcrR family transcriptional regulator [Gandjariella thermophila]|uniref:TetR family transcriptional regulator n=1 Tax=Gandjariella thermophila TaxID=1931992 RepID=A0A4D4JBV7_9PSEU|nr:TetR/AcrR family transcriptional regulator [Gandjariella thermophila]GDY33074.1 TetR family transcriptional regulator [Gandjariella thermophila]